MAGQKLPILAEHLEQPVENQSRYLTILSMSIAVRARLLCIACVICDDVWR
jgi:hypothetical protein